MFQTIEIFDLAEARARHSAARQNVIAQNIANADTPGYRAADLRPFAEVYDRAGMAGLFDSAALIQEFEVAGAASPNGNTVSLEQEMVRSVDAQRDHSRALMVYRSALNVMRTGLGR